jgi:hypothetical protein
MRNDDEIYVGKGQEHSGYRKCPTYIDKNTQYIDWR